MTQQKKKKKLIQMYNNAKSHIGERKWTKPFYTLKRTQGKRGDGGEPQEEQRAAQIVKLTGHQIGLSRKNNKIPTL